MKTVSLALLLMASMAFVLLGCSDNAQSPVEPGAEITAATSVVQSLAKQDGVHSVIGAAFWKSIPVTGETNVRYVFAAFRHEDGKSTGEVELRDKGPMYIGKAKVYDLKVSGNIAKLAFKFMSGNLGGFYNPVVDIKKIHGWLVAIDNRGCAGKNTPDLVSMILFTDGSDIGTGTIDGIDKMQPQEFLNWMKTYLLPLYGVTYEQFLSAPDRGSVEIR